MMKVQTYIINRKNHKEIIGKYDYLKLFKLFVSRYIAKRIKSQTS